MLTRRHLREVTIQLLYTHSITPLIGSPALPDTNPTSDLLSEDSFIWDTVLEKELLHHVKITRKALFHFLQARVQPMHTVLAHQDAFSLLLRAHHTNGEYADLAAKFDAWITLEEQFDQLIAELVKRKNNRKEIDLNELSPLFRLNQTLLISRAYLLSAFECDQPLLRKGESTVANLKKLHKIGERLRFLEDPTLPHDLKDITHLRQSYETIQGIKREASSLFLRIIQEQQRLDETLQNIVEHYSLKRISSIDHAILLLAMYEILYIPSIPPKVSINEAIEIAEFFGTTESTRFVNGILDQLYHSTELITTLNPKSA